MEETAELIAKEEELKENCKKAIKELFNNLQSFYLIETRIDSLECDDKELSSTRGYYNGKSFILVELVEKLKEWIDNL